MHTDNKNIMLVDYCRLDEIPACKLKLKAELFSTFCKIAKESERYAFTFWYTELPLSKRGNSVQLAINAVIKDRHTDTDDVFKKVIPYTGRTLFSFFSSIFKLNKNHNEYLGEKKMIVKCPKCGTIIPCSTSNETALLKEEIKNKDLIIEQLRKENEEYETIIKNMTVEEKAETPATEEILEEKVEEPNNEIPTNTEMTEEAVSEPAEPTAEETHEEIKKETLTTEAPAEETIVEPVEEVRENEPSIEPAEEKIEVEVEQPSEIVEENKEENVTPIEEVSPVVEENNKANEEEKVEAVPCDSINEIEEKIETVEKQAQEEVKEEAPKTDEDPYHIHTPIIVKI